MTQRVKRLLFPLLSGLLITTPCLAQQKNQIRFPVNEELKQTLRGADLLMKKGAHEEALELYLEILKQDNNPKESNFILELTDEKKRNPYQAFKPRRFVGLRAHVQEKLKGLPAKVQDIYREKNDYRAKAFYKDVLFDGSETALEKFYADYAISSYGTKALTRLASIAFEKGNLDRTHRYVDLLLKDHASTLNPAEIRAFKRQKLMCLMGLGRLKEVKSLCDTLSIKGKDARFSFGDAVLTRAQIEERTARFKGSLAQKENKELSHIRGQAHHANKYDASLWIGRARFMPKSYSSPQRRRNFNRNNRFRPYGYNRPRNNSNANSTLPIVLEAERRVKGPKGQKAQLVKQPIALLSSGTSLDTIWLNDGSRGPRILLPSTSYYVEDNDKVLHGGAVSNRIFVTSFVARVNNAENYKGIPIKVNLPVRKLAALDTKNWRWIWNHQQILKNTPFAKASFPSPPVIVDDTIYASAIVIEGFVRSYVLAFDLKTGKIKWSTWICSGQVEQTMFGEHAREPLVSSVAVKDGRVFHCSSLGAMAALDTRTGKPIWMTSYEQIEIEPPRGYYPVQRSLGWANNPPLVSDGIVVATPLDSNYAVAYDIKTGKRAWRSPRRRLNSSELRYMVGASDGHVVFSGGSHVECLTIKGGKFKWAYKRFFNEKIAGRGVIANGRVCLSISPQGSGYPARVCQWDLKTGKLARTERTTGTKGGDIAMFGDTILILERGLISAFENKEPQRRSRDF